MARPSYFEEMRAKYNNASFYDRMSAGEIAMNVPRIIRDIYYNNIKEQDYVYFQNDKIIRSCLEVCGKEAEEARSINFALQFYINDVLAKGMMPCMSTNKVREISAAGAALQKFNSRWNVWHVCYWSFNNIMNGGPIVESLESIKAFNKDAILNAV